MPRFNGTGPHRFGAGRGLRNRRRGFWNCFNIFRKASFYQEDTEEQKKNCDFKKLKKKK